MNSSKIVLILLFVVIPFCIHSRPADPAPCTLFVTKEIHPPTVVELDAQHQQGLNHIVRDIANLHSRLQTSSYSEIENHPRISISGNWNQMCLVNLMTLIQNQGMNRKLFNDGALTTLDMMLDLVDPFVAPFSTLKSFLTSEVIEELILAALRSDNPSETLQEKLEEKAEENNTSLPEGEEGERLQKQMEQLMELYALAKENSTLPNDAKWNSWDFDPGRSTLDDFVPDFLMAPDRVIPSQAMARFGTVDADESPVEDNSDGKGLTVQRVVMMGIAEKPYPASTQCQGQILDYKVTINNYGHVEDGRFVSDFIEYDIELNCCEEEEEEEVSYNNLENISYSSLGDTAAHFPGETYNLLVGGGIGYGRESGDNLFCAGVTGQYYPDLPVGACGAQPGVGLNLKYDYSGFSEDTYSFRNNNFIVEPQLLLQSHILPNVNLISGVSFPISFGSQTNDFDGVSTKQNTSGFGVSLTSGLALELPNWSFQLQTDVLGWRRQTIEDIGSGGGSSMSSDWSLGLNKGNTVGLTIAKRLNTL